MENIINTFYKGNINKFGFGGWNTTKNNMKEILWSYPYPSNMGRQIEKYFQKGNIKTEDNSKNIHKNYVPSVYSQVIPKKDRVDFSEANAEELKPISVFQYKNFDNHGFMNTQIKPVPTENFSPALIRMELLERKMNELEDKARIEMQNSLNQINEQYIDPRFKQFLDKNQGKYDVFGNDPDPLEQRRNLVKNNIDNIKSRIQNDSNQSVKRKKKVKKKKNKKKRKNFFDDIEDIQEKNEDEEKEEKEEEEEEVATQKDKKLTDSPLTLIRNINNLPKKSVSPLKRQTYLASPRKSILKNTLVNTMNSRKNSISQGKTIRGTITDTKRGSIIGAKRGSIKGSVRGSIRGSARGSIQVSPRKSSIQRRSSIKEKEENQIEKVLGDIGYSFEGITNKEKELQFQTNRIGKDFDKLLHEMKEFQRTIKTKLNIHYSDGESKINILKDIFLLDNKADMKNAVDRALNKIKEPFDKEAYKNKVDKEKLEEIKDLIDKKIDEYNYGENKIDYNKKIYDEKEQMMHNNIINKYEYRKYRQKVNNKVTTLPSIFIKASKFIMSKEDNDKLTTKKTNKSSTQSTQSKNIVFNKIREETIHFGDTIKQDSEFESKENSQISQLPKMNPEEEEEKKDNEENIENIEAKSEDWLSDNEEDKIDNIPNEENKTNKKISGNTNKSKIKNESNKSKEKNKENEEEKEKDKEIEDNKKTEKDMEDKKDEEKENNENEKDDYKEKLDEKNEENVSFDNDDEEKNDEENENDREIEKNELFKKKMENEENVNNNNDENENEELENE